MNESVTKAELADLLFERLGLNKREAKDMVDAFFGEVSAALEKGEEVKLSGFGIFNLREKSATTGPQPENRRNDSDSSAPRCNLSRQQQT